MMVRRRIRGVVLIAVVVIGTARASSADCTATVRPPTAEEKRIYADGFALFQRVAPAAPAGWEQHDSPKDAVLTEVCADPGQRLTRWLYSRGLSRKEGEQQRRDAADQQVLAAAQRNQAIRKANEGKLAEVEKQIAAEMKKMQGLAAARKYAEMEAVEATMKKLMEQQQSLMGLDEHDAAMKAIGAESNKDVSASFSMIVGETNVDTQGFKPMSVASGRGFRQDYDGSGNPRVTLLIVLNPAVSRTLGQTVMRIEGDPARAEALLKSTKLQ